ncbi:MAG TPA: S-layer homology domain-containing protein [Thermoanaerobacterales bacterium]|nr:S-layer homology domain-containing protein [Thermoanaerobacterales bacterium]
MKKLLIFFMIFSVLMNQGYALSAPAGFSGGVNNEYTYEEMVFVTGKPLKFTGTVSISEREKQDSKTVSYSFDLTSPDLSEKNQLRRTVTYVTQYNNRNDKGQAIAQTEVQSYNERIIIGRDQYNLEDYQFSKSDVIDNRPASDFYSGNFNGRKYYTINKNEGNVVIEITGGDVGYENFWGSTETQIMVFSISSQRYVVDEQNNEKKSVSWKGTVNVQVSDSMTKSLSYYDNEATLSSFNGGYVRTTEREMVSKYEYNLPKMNGNIPDGSKRNNDSVSLSAQMVPRVERLIVPKFRDVEGHWAQDYIEKLYSLDVFDTSSSFFVPEAPMTREEFIKGIIRACNIRSSMDTQKKTVTRRKQAPEVSPFKDVSPQDPDYSYIKEGLDKGIVTGVTKDSFKPGAPLTRAQAVTILVRALGFGNKAPNPGYQTSFSDDDKIPYWAKDSIYVAREINLIEGDSQNRVNPNKVMTRAEASAMLVRFLEFLQKDLQKDYRENIML